MSIIEKILAPIAPHQCIGCEAEATLLCAACTAHLTRLPERCYRCRRLSPGGRTCPSCRSSSSLYAVRAVAAYEGLSKELIARLKFQGARASADEIAHLFLDAELPKRAIIVHAPTASKRIRQRGYDQAALIARALSRQSGIPHASLLRRIGQQKQVGAGRRQRLSQLQEAFGVSNPRLLSGAHIILVDDVLTTGATLEAAARTLKAAGAKRVSGFVFAQA